MQALLEPAIGLALRLAAALAALWLGWQIEPWLGPIPSAALGGRSIPAEHDAIIGIATWYVAAHLAIYLVAALLRRRRPASRATVVIRSYWFAVTATAVATAAIFLFTDLPFRTNFFVGVFVALTTVYAGGLAIAARRESAATQPEGRRSHPGRELVESLTSPEGVVAALSCGSLATIMILFLVSLDVRNALNYFRSRASAEVSEAWAVVDLFDGMRFDQPIDLEIPAADPASLFVLTRPGQLLRVDGGGGTSEVVLDFRARVIDTRIENGALGFALHPTFGTGEGPGAGNVYVYYTGATDDARDRQVNRLVRFDLTPASVEERTRTETILIEQPRDRSGFHNGGAVVFGPDGMLYVGIGDIGDEANGQDATERLAAGILRIDVDRRGGEISTPIAPRIREGRTQYYYIPSDNPFVGEPDVLHEYWALGLRNPFRIFFDPDRDVVWVGDVGNERYEEVDIVTAGSNGGWPYAEGPERTGAAPAEPLGVELEPFHFYRQTSVMRAVIGGVVYQGTRLPGLRGRYVFADNQAGLVLQLDPARPEAGHVAIARAPQLASYGITSITEAPDGQLLLTTLGSPAEPSGRILTLRELNEAPDDDVAETGSGAELYESFCARCHGADGEGGPATEQMVARPDFTDPIWQRETPDTRITTIIREGGEAVGASAAMPAWGGVLGGAEVGLVVDHIRGFGRRHATKSSQAGTD